MDRAWFSAIFARTEAFFERERAQLPLWFVVAFGVGIAGWLWLPEPVEWASLIVISSGTALAGLTIARSRVARALFLGGMAVAIGCALAWLRSHLVASERLDCPMAASFEAMVEKVESRAAKGDLRLTLAPVDQHLPPRVRVSLPEADAPKGLGNGAAIRLKARLQPPPPMALPGGHVFARDACVAESSRLASQP